MLSGQMYSARFSQTKVLHERLEFAVKVYLNCSKSGTGLSFRTENWAPAYCVFKDMSLLCNALPSLGHLWHLPSGALLCGGLLLHQAQEGKQK